MNENILSQRIAELRRAAGFTQEQLAARLGVSFQAVSKWENAQSCPDIMLLPDLADIFRVSIDSLFGRDAAPVPERPLPVIEDALPPEETLPWPDDDAFYFVLYRGHELILEEPYFPNDPRRRLEFCWEGPLRDLHSVCSVRCGAVSGFVSAGGDVSCDRVGGNVESDGDVDCDDVLGHVNAGGDVDCGDVAGNVSAGGDVDCGDVAGGVSAGGDVDCDNVLGGVSAGGEVDGDDDFAELGEHLGELGEHLGELGERFAGFGQQLGEKLGRTINGRFGRHGRTEDDGDEKR